MRVPPEIDELMWQIAEADDQDALAEFEERYPEFLPEMTKRVSMVRGLKGSRPLKAVKRRERFMPSRQVKNESGPFPKWAVALLGVTAVAAISFATYGVAQFIENRNAPPTTVVLQQPPVNTPTTDPTTSQNQQPPLQNTPVTTPEQQTTEPQQQRPVSPFETPVTVVASQISLRAALYDIASQANVELELAPGFQDQEIYIDYRGVPAIEVLRDLGRNCGFTPFIQTLQKALIIPAVDGRYNDQTEPTLPGLSGAVGDSPREGSGSVSELPY